MFSIVRNVILSQNYLTFISANKYVTFFSGSQKINSWKSKGISEESIKNSVGSKDTFAPYLIDYCPLPEAPFSGNCLRESSISANRDAVNLKVSYAHYIHGQEISAQI